jgi:hypothetical protein
MLEFKLKDRNYIDHFRLGWMCVRVNSMLMHHVHSNKLLNQWYPSEKHSNSLTATPFTKEEKNNYKNYKLNQLKDWYGLEEDKLKELGYITENKNEKTTYTGLLTKSAKKNLQKAIDNMVLGSVDKLIYNPKNKKHQKHRLSFYTLTISQKEIFDYKSCYPLLLRPFLQWLDKTKNISSYIWKVELQKRKQLHYHIISPTWIHWKEIRNKWNEIQIKAGINLDNYRGLETNSTDVENILDIKGITTYIAKEIMKNVQNQEAINIKLWGCSKGLNNVPYFTFPFNEYNINKLINHKEAYKPIYENEFCNIFDLRYKSAIELMDDNQRQQYSNYITNLRALVNKNENINQYLY